MPFHQRVGFNLQDESFQYRLGNDEAMRGELLAIRDAIDHTAWGVDPEDETDFYHLDALGSVRAITNQDGTEIERHEYFAFGDEWNAPATTVESRRFTGKERDAETGYDYFGARTYMARAGRFSSVDPVLEIETALVDPQRWNRYAYARNNPLRFVDPDGADIWDFVNGVGDAIKANLAWGLGRSQGGNADFRAGQAVGDLASLAMSAYEFTQGTAATGGGLALCGTGVGCLVGAPTAAAGAAVSGHAIGVGVAAGVSLMSSTGNGGGAKSVNQMNKEVQRGKAPDGVKRVDKGKVKGEQDNVHFTDGSALNRDGTWKHGIKKLTRDQEEWLRANGWTVPK